LKLKLPNLKKQRIIDEENGIMEIEKNDCKFKINNKLKNLLFDD
jgi:hypothetical protein